MRAVVRGSSACQRPGDLPALRVACRYSPVGFDRQQYVEFLSSHSHSPSSSSSLSLGNGGCAADDDGAKEAWNSGPIRLTAGAFLMSRYSKLGRQRNPSGRCVQQGRSSSFKSLMLLNSADAGAHIQLGRWQPTYPPDTYRFSMQVGGQSFSRTACWCSCFSLAS